MCSHYESVKDRERFRIEFAVDPPLEEGKTDVWPGYLASFIRKHPHVDSGDDAVPAGEALIGQFGLIPHWATDTKIGRNTFNCRSETAAEKPSFRDAFKQNRRCIVPAAAIYEPDWRTGKAISTRIERVDGAPMGIAGLWSAWKSPKGEWLHSFTMLTINAEHHPLMNQFHKPGDEKRMVVIIPRQRYREWLSGDSAFSSFLNMPDAEELKVAQTPSV